MVGPSTLLVSPTLNQVISVFGEGVPKPVLFKTP